MVIKMENDFDGSTPTCEKPKKSFSCASHIKGLQKRCSNRKTLILSGLFCFYGQNSSHRFERKKDIFPRQDLNSR